jgi:hypothetical protein
MTVMVNHNYPSANDLTVVDEANEPVEGVVVTIFTLANYSAGIVDTWVGQTDTDVNGNWNQPIYLDEAQTYVVHFEKVTEYGPTTLEVTT